MKSKFWFLVPLAFAFLATLVWYGVRTNRLEVISTVSKNKTPKIYFESPPPDSLRGKIVSKKGDVFWESRTATDEAKLDSVAEALQGEVFETKDDGSISFDFANTLDVALGVKTKISFAQTLPVDFVVVQDSGTATYKKLGDVPVSIRSLALLISAKDKSSLRLSIDSEGRFITVDILGGSCEIAYEDLEHNSYTKTFNAPSEFIFDNTSRQLSQE